MPDRPPWSSAMSSTPNRATCICQPRRGDGGRHPDTPAMNVNRLCGSGAQAVRVGDPGADAGRCRFRAGGRRGKHEPVALCPAAGALGPEDGRCGAQDMMLGALNCPFGTGHMGVTAENVAPSMAFRAVPIRTLSRWKARRARPAPSKRAGSSRPDRAGRGQGRKPRDRDFRDRRTPQSHHGRGAGRAAAVFQKDGSVTAGNASGINDGAAALVLARAEAAQAAHGLKPRARVLGYAHAGVRPECDGHRPDPGGGAALAARTGLAASDFDVIESNEAFAAQALAVTKALDLDPDEGQSERWCDRTGPSQWARPARSSWSRHCYELERIGGSNARLSRCASAAGRASRWRSSGSSETAGSEGSGSR
jgi:acetyl-CoA C-acetyltransferase